MDTLNHNREKPKFIEKRIISICENFGCKTMGEGLGFEGKKTYFTFSSEYKDCIVMFVLEWEGGGDLPEYTGG